jgi:hypothetical protein
MVWSDALRALVLAASASSPGAAQQAIAGVFRRGLTVAEGSRHGPLIEMAQQGERRGHTHAGSGAVVGGRSAKQLEPHRQREPDGAV